MVLLFEDETTRRIDNTSAWRTTSGFRQFVGIVERLRRTDSGPLSEVMLKNELKRSLRGLQYSSDDEINSAVLEGARRCAEQLDAGVFYSERNRAFLTKKPSLNPPLPGRDRGDHELQYRLPNNNFKHMQ